MAVDGNKAQRWMNRRSTQRKQQSAFNYGAERGLFGKANPLNFDNRQQYDRIAAWLHAAKAAQQAQMTGGPQAGVQGAQMYAPRTAINPMPAGPQGPLSDMATIGSHPRSGGVFNDGGPLSWLPDAPWSHPARQQPQRLPMDDYGMDPETAAQYRPYWEYGG